VALAGPLALLALRGRDCGMKLNPLEPVSLGDVCRLQYRKQHGLCVDCYLPEALVFCGVTVYVVCGIELLISCVESCYEIRSTRDTDAA
jgi:hypothetical protein